MGAHGVDAAILQYDNLVCMEHGSERCAMMIFVASGMLLNSPSRILASVAVSTALVESSSINTFGFFSSALAIQSRCFRPPDTLTPPWPSSVS